eukprot:557576-Amphidinium_carterae.1
MVHRLTRAAIRSAPESTEASPFVNSSQNALLAWHWKLLSFVALQVAIRSLANSFCDLPKKLHAIDPKRTRSNSLVRELAGRGKIETEAILAARRRSSTAESEFEAVPELTSRFRSPQPEAQCRIWNGQTNLYGFWFWSKLPPVPLVALPELFA